MTHRIRKHRASSSLSRSTGRCGGPHGSLIKTTRAAEHSRRRLTGASQGRCCGCFCLRGGGSRRTIRAATGGEPRHGGDQFAQDPGGRGMRSADTVTGVQAVRYGSAPDHSRAATSIQHAGATGPVNLSRRRLAGAGRLASSQSRRPTGKVDRHRTMPAGAARSARFSFRSSSRRRAHRRR